MTTKSVAEFYQEHTTFVAAHNYWLMKGLVNISPFNALCRQTGAIYILFYCTLVLPSDRQSLLILCRILRILQTSNTSIRAFSILAARR